MTSPWRILSLGLHWSDFSLNDPIISSQRNYMLCRRKKKSYIFFSELAAEDNKYSVIRFHFTLNIFKGALLNYMIIENLIILHL